MRIFIIHNYYQNRGGEDIVFENEVHNLSRENEVEIYATKNLTGFKGFVQFLLYPWNSIAANRIIKRIKAFNPDIVHIHNIHYAIGPLLIRKLNQQIIPHILTLHNYRLVCPSATLFHQGKIFDQSIHQNFPVSAIKAKVHNGSFFKTLWIACTYYLHKKINTWRPNTFFLVLTEYAKNLIANSKAEIELDKIIVKPNFIDYNPPIDKVKRGEHLLFVGRLSKEKGILNFANKIAGSNYCLKIIGSGPEKNEIENLASQFPENIQYLGFQNEKFINNELRLCTALVLPSLCIEGMPLTILEALANGTPVLSSDIGVLKYLIKPMITGLLFDPHNTKDIHNTLNKWLSLSLEQKEEISANCKHEFSSHYSKELVMDQLIDIYHSVITHTNKKYES